MGRASSLRGMVGELCTEADACATACDSPLVYMLFCMCWVASILTENVPQRFVSMWLVILRRRVLTPGFAMDAPWSRLRHTNSWLAAVPFNKCQHAWQRIWYFSATALTQRLTEDAPSRT